MTIKYKAEILSDTQIHQGDIFTNIPFYESYKESNKVFELSVLHFPYVVILSQECDLDLNCKERLTLNLNNSCDVALKHDKFLISLLCAPLYNAEHLFAGNHLSELKLEAESKNSNQRSFVKNNRDPRYHYIEFEDSIKIVACVIDFKHYFTVSVNELESRLKDRVCSLKPLFREAVTQRFSNFLSRIGLPERE